MLIQVVENCVLLAAALSSFFVITVSNPILSLLWLIVSFGFSSILFMIFGIEFLSLLVFMVYIGAIAVLFLFVIMMLNIKIVEISTTYFRYLPVSFFIIVFFLLELIVSLYLKFGTSYMVYYDIYVNWIFLFDYAGNISLFGYYFFGVFNYFLLVIALILFVSMLGSIVLVVNWSQVPFYSKFVYNDSLFFHKNKITFIK